MNSKIISNIPTNYGVIVMKMLSLIFLLLLMTYTHCSADEFLDKTSACRMEVKILGPDVLQEDENCIWLDENLTQVKEKCTNCLVDLKLIKEVSQGNFDY
ncbi:MAG: hypothetical protein OQL19_06815 [Gammaproteobacteria bacterium]|nr:hypothetical protein [Gammaproteobacteria bacterium]